MQGSKLSVNLSNLIHFCYQIQKSAIIKTSTDVELRHPRCVYNKW